MNDAIRSRGPDDEGFFFADSVGLGQRRLSIIDLATGHQPMTTASGRYTITFNGEVYNYRELRVELARLGVVFKTTSDTEVVLELFAREGRACLDKLNGMFAFAIWDAAHKKLFAARDRMGKKPFYYSVVGGSFVFGSEIKALFKHPDIKKEIDPFAVRLFFTYECVPAPHAIIKGVHKLKQGHCLEFSAQGLSVRRYWNLRFDQKTTDSFEEAPKKLIEKIDRAVQYRLIADVPVGVFLSGGIDSSTVVAMIARHREGKKIPTFSINFEERSYNESSYSSLIAKKFDTDHHEETLSAKRMLEILPAVMDYMDEPLADGSILPTYLLSQFTRQHVKVAIGGDGADELFAGYPTFFANSLADLCQKIPASIWSLAQKIARLVPVSDKNMSLDFKLNLFLSALKYKGPERNQVWLSGARPEEQDRLFMPGFVEQTANQDPLGLIAEELSTFHTTDRSDELLYYYQKFYMCDDVLVKVDRASMANSLEVRAPFLDREVVEYANSLPFNFKHRGRTTKRVLKKALEGILPKKILYRPKKGFGIPISGWLKNEMRLKLESTLNRTRIEKDGLFRWNYVDELVKQHVENKRNHRKQLFSLFVFHQWMDRFLDSRSCQG
jgi:asparagine synthase (glutamine-hydrolysing)